MTVKEMQVPIVVVLKAMGMESDQEIVQMVGRDPKYAGILAPSLQVCTTCLLLMLGTFRKHSLIRENFMSNLSSLLHCMFFFSCRSVLPLASILSNRRWSTLVSRFVGYKAVRPDSIDYGI
jgi:hypothetical protein